MSILERIASIRRETIKREGYTLGAVVPEERDLPLIPFGQKPFVICEIKRRSPSKGKISEISDPVKQAAIYVEKGIRNISVLTEEDHFDGSLDDLMAVKRAFPQISVLRKDFLLEKEDVDISYRAGADAILLIAALLDQDKLIELYEYAQSLNLSVLVEVHNREEVDKVKPFKPEFTGINCRNLKTFKIDQTLPLILKEFIDWDTKLVYESGVTSFNEAIIPFESGFSGILVGESVVRDTDLIDDLIQAEQRTGEHNFWNRLYSASQNTPQLAATFPNTNISELCSGDFYSGRHRKRPLVKICGITNREDARAAVELGADILGFVMAESPRRADPAFVRSISELPVLKVAVVVTSDAEPDREVMNLLEKGYLDAVQFHGDESPRSLRKFSYPCYKALRMKESEDSLDIGRFPGPRVLIDAWTKDAYGGTGTRIDDISIKKASDVRPLWIAGGLSPENIQSVVDNYHPELIDASSKLESSKGKKDYEKMKKFFAELGYENI